MSFIFTVATAALLVGSLGCEAAFDQCPTGTTGPDQPVNPTASAEQVLGTGIDRFGSCATPRKCYDYDGHPGRPCCWQCGPSGNGNLQQGQIAGRSCGFCISRPQYCASPTAVTGVTAVATSLEIYTFAATVTCACGYISTLGTPTKCSSNNAATAWTYTGTCTKIDSFDDIASCQAGKGCNDDKNLASSSTGTGTVQECIAQCVASSDCEWVGYQHPTKLSTTTTPAATAAAPSCNGVLDHPSCKGRQFLCTSNDAAVRQLYRAQCLVMCGECIDTTTTSTTKTTTTTTTTTSTTSSPTPGQCEFWKVAGHRGTTCKAPHPVPGHEIYRVKKPSCTLPAFFWRFPQESSAPRDACPGIYGSGECWDPNTQKCVDVVYPWRVPEAGLPITTTACTAGANGASCQNSGTASGTGDNCSCNCATGYEGSNCQTAKACTAGANGASCQNSGTASGTGDNCSCNCATGYEGANCQTAKACTAGANGASCQNGGTAVGTGNNCGCNCATGYEGANCQTAKACTAGANGAPCQNSGTAYGTVAAGNCGCSCLVNKQPVGFVGANCQTPKACDMYTRTCVYRNWWTGSCFVYTNIPNVGCLTAVAQARATGAKALAAGDDDGDGDGEEGGVVLNEDLTDTEKAEMSAGCTLFKESDGQVLPEWAAQVNESATTVITVIETICAELDVEGAAAIATLETTTTNTQPTPAGVARTVFAGIIAACGLYVVWVVARKTPPSNSNKDVLDAPENMAEISEI